MEVMALVVFPTQMVQQAVQEQLLTREQVGLVVEEVVIGIIGLVEEVVAVILVEEVVFIMVLVAVVVPIHQFH